MRLLNLLNNDNVKNVHCFNAQKTRLICQQQQ